MGCISSKKARSESSPEYQHYTTTTSSSSSSNRRGNDGRRLLSSSSSTVHARGGFGQLEKIKEEPEKEEGVEDDDEEDFIKEKHNHSGNLKAIKRGSNHKKAVFSLKFGRLTEGEHVAAGWPAWLSAVAGEAIDGWLPLRSDAFKRLEKIGQGTYSDVYRARNVETGRIVAVKKVRFDNFQPESVRFMAREIRILRKLDHPNIMKLEGIITSRLSCHIYLVFEYMEHDLAGLLSCPDIKFTDSQIKCYMRQLLRGLEHCHSRGILHRDIKTSNILINNEGILKIADFGLANFMKPKHKQPLTSRVVTLWYRPPELLLGSTSYEEAVDLWSVGCVFAELFIGRPLLKGRTEVEQLHKIFKLCGTPPDDYWRESKLPLAHMFKPQQPYESALRERCKEFPKSAVSLIETFLSFEPHKRGTASSALNSKYFTTKPYACDPSSLPKYAPNKEMDAKYREDARRRKTGVHGSRISRRARKILQESSEEGEGGDEVARRSHGGSTSMHRRRSGVGSRTGLKQQAYDTVSEASQMTEESQTSFVSTRSVPVQVSSSSVFVHNYQTSRRQIYNLGDPSLRANEWENDETPSGRVQRHNRAMAWEQDLSNHQDDDTFDDDTFDEPQGFYTENASKKKGRVTFSGPLVYGSEEMASRQQHDQPLNKSRFYKDL